MELCGSLAVDGWTTELDVGLAMLAVWSFRFLYARCLQAVR